jgi:hypothetical protein
VVLVSIFGVTTAGGLYFDGFIVLMAEKSGKKARQAVLHGFGTQFFGKSLFLLVMIS